ncbi:hypothetical protein JMJ56_26355 [Belnapia sp. T18]|uniref:Lipoprotein n=1 Tax=Belnapia arida TaxID=2804533 RepID=A0ABS1UCU7_9PROT|nr:hypothetical protein [Belnapia arida]MBL6081517.1 hypothetical protein [Belnapia arida]
MPLRRSHAAALLGLVLSLAACAALDRIGGDRMQQVPTAQLCTWRDNPVSGGQMRRELARRGEECGEPRPVLAEAPPTVRQPEPPQAAVEQPAADPVPDVAPGPEPVATLVTPACAARDLRRGGEGEPKQRAVRFTNRCDFPVKVLYAADRSKLLSRETGLLRPGEDSGFARIEDGLDLPGYVVCSYARAPASSPCRVGPERR